MQQRQTGEGEVGVLLDAMVWPYRGLVEQASAMRVGVVLGAEEWAF